jgi:ribose transport system permease protein
VIGKVPSFLVTLCMLTVLDGLSLIICQGSPVNILDMNYLKIASGKLFGNFPNIGLWAIGIYFLSIFIGFVSRSGRYLFTIGGGERVTYFSGVPVNREKILAFVYSGVLCGLAGALLGARMQSGTPRMGEQFLMDSIAAVVMGGTALTGGVGGPHRTIVGVIIIAVLGNGMNIIDVQPYFQIIIKGTVTIVAVAATIDRSRIERVK